MSDTVGLLLHAQRQRLLAGIERDNQTIATLHRGIELQVAEARNRIAVARREVSIVEQCMREQGFPV